MTAGVHSGRFGVINGINSVRNWNVNEERANTKYNNSATLNGAGRTKGVHSWSGTYNAYGVIPTYMPGDSATFLGYTAPTNDTISGTGLTYNGTIVIDSVAITWNFVTGELISHAVNFTGSGALTTVEADTAVLDAAIPAVKPALTLTANFSAAGSVYTAISNVTQVTLTITSSTQKSANSSTAGFTSAYRGDIDWSMSIQQEEVSRDATTQLVLGNDYYFKLFTDASLFWLLKWGQVKNFTGIEVNRETQAIIKRTINVEMNGFVGSPVVAGQIVKPGATVWWP